MGISLGDIGAAAGVLNPVGLIGNGAAMAGDILQYEGQMQTNAANEAMVTQQDNFQAQMSNTAYQRATSDMKAAGINPMLAATNGGASSPAGAIAPMTSPTQVAGQALEKLGPQLISSANDIMRTKAATDVATSQASSNYADAALKTAKVAETPSNISANSAAAAKANADAALDRAEIPFQQSKGDAVQMVRDFVKSINGGAVSNSARKRMLPSSQNNMSDRDWINSQPPPP